MGNLSGTGSSQIDGGSRMTEAFGGASLGGREMFLGSVNFTTGPDYGWTGPMGLFLISDGFSAGDTNALDAILATFLAAVGR